MNRANRASHMWVRALGAVALVGISASAFAWRHTRQDALVVHEWGTFTSMQGADGVSMEGMQHESAQLPAFVHSRVESTRSPFSAYGDGSRNVPVRRCLGKMETPVIYVHSGSPRHLRVHVDFKGLLTQWYPAASSAIPAFPDAPGVRDLREIATSSLEWELDVLPAKSGRPPGVPEVAHDEDWDLARQVDASYVRTTGTTEAEQYVFYRGLTSFAPVAHVEAPSAGHATVKNDAQDPIAHGFVLEMGKDGGRFRAVERLAPGESRPVVLDGEGWKSRAATIAGIEAKMQDALVGEGLFADEARAMVRTWSPTWFASEGTRFLYLLPRASTDAVLPMQITPRPDALVRVMVGRVEYLTVEKETAIASDLLAATFAPPEERERAMTRLGALGRFFEPAVRSIEHRSTDQGIKIAAAQLLARYATEESRSRFTER